MRHRPLHAALSAFADEAAAQLCGETADGAEVPFELIESRRARRDTPLYCYRPLTDAFIRQHIGVLGRLPSYPAAARALAAMDGVDEYLREQGEPRIPSDRRECADAGLRVFISRVFSEASEFVVTDERFERAYGEIEGALFVGRSEAIVVAPVLGLRIVSSSDRARRGAVARARRRARRRARGGDLAAGRRGARGARLPDACPAAPAGRRR